VRLIILRILVALALFLPALSGCGPESTRPLPVEEKPTYFPLNDKEAESLAAHVSTREQGLASFADLRPGLEDSLRYIGNRPQDAVCVNQPGLLLTWGMLKDSVSELLGMLDDIDRDPALLAERFRWLRLNPGTLLTGYYEPWLEASLTSGGKYTYPLYGVPDDLKTVDLGMFHPRWKGQQLTYRQGADGIVPYHDRQAIDGKGVLAGKGLAIAWAADPIDVFFLQIQGSGRLDLPDGTFSHILYAGKNGHAYRSLGKILIERGAVPREEMSMQRIRKYLNENPGVAQELLFKNRSYVFFRLADEGPYGSIGSILTPRVSVAVDRRMIPLGSVVLKTVLPQYKTGESRQFLALMLAQDTGGAIKGTRMDLFCGTGIEAETLAGHLQEESEAFMLLSKRVLGALPDNMQ